MVKSSILTSPFVWEYDTPRVCAAVSMLDMYFDRLSVMPCGSSAPSKNDNSNATILISK